MSGVRNAIGSFFGKAANAVSGAANAVTGALSPNSSPSYNTLSGSTAPPAPVMRPRVGTGLLTTPLKPVATVTRAAGSTMQSLQRGGRRRKSRRTLKKARRASRSRRKCGY